LTLATQHLHSSFTFFFVISISLSTPPSTIASEQKFQVPISPLCECLVCHSAPSSYYRL
jgi:hypothetical protein